MTEDDALRDEALLLMARYRGWALQRAAQLAADFTATGHRVGWLPSDLELVLGECPGVPGDTRPR